MLSAKEDLLNVKLDLSDRINRAKMETVIWIVGIGILQFIAIILSRKNSYRHSLNHFIS